MSKVNNNSKISVPYYAVWQKDGFSEESFEYGRYSTLEEAQKVCSIKNTESIRYNGDLHDIYSVRLITEDVLKKMAAKESAWNSEFSYSSEALRPVLKNMLSGFAEEWTRILEKHRPGRKMKSVHHKLWPVENAGIISAIRLDSYIYRGREKEIELNAYFEFQGGEIAGRGSVTCPMTIIPLSSNEISDWANSYERVDEFFDVIYYTINVFRDSCEYIDNSDYEIIGDKE